MRIMERKKKIELGENQKRERMRNRLRKKVTEFSRGEGKERKGVKVTRRKEQNEKE